MGLVAYLLVGCAQIAGIDETTGAVPPELASLRVERLSVGASIVRSPLDLPSLQATYLIENPDASDGFDRLPAEMIEPGLWTAEVGEGTPAVMFSIPEYPDGELRILQLPYRNVKTLFGVLEHPDPSPAPSAGTITVMASIPAMGATDRFQFYSVGTWVTRNFTPAEEPMLGATSFGPVTFNYDTTNRITGRPFEKITTADATLLLRYSGAKLTGVMEGTPFDQTGTDTVMGTLTQVSATETLSATLNNTTISARYAVLRPAMPAPSMEWYLAAAPGFAGGNVSGPRLDSGVVSELSPSALDVMYGNPFASKGWQAALQWATSSSRSYTPPGAPGPATLSAGVSQIVTPASGLVLDLPAGLPELITLNAQPLSTDGATIPKPAKALAASFIVPPTPSNTLYHLLVIELKPATAALERRVLCMLTSTTPAFTVPAELFQSGTSYTLRAVTKAGGYPNLADGDLVTRTLPLAQAFMDSGVFTVLP